ncbi:Activin receptor type-2B-like protein [Leptotrombidium deliense]|uniref:Serine/threonine-protein kinase receptor n=1 Tax=Leptotrombidium deliense TaxID=299467 RepID=A0A443SR12_9ACAR|nr:Activin receptor type-2B-like protein [Leptotrombidium deliense]
MKAKTKGNRDSHRKATATKRCSFYNETLCQGNDCEEREEECKSNDNTSDKSTLCYVLWQNKFTNSSDVSVRLKGCWFGPLDGCHEENRCVENRKGTKGDLYFCCCAGDLCNKQFFHFPNETHSKVPMSTIPLVSPPQATSYSSIILVTLIPMFLLVLLFTVAYWFFRLRRMPRFDELPTKDDMFPVSDFTTQIVPYKEPVQLIEVKATGRFGAVWKARIPPNNKSEEKFVASKIFPRQDKSSWMTEVEVYQLVKMKHENILCYLGAHEAGGKLPYNIEYWLVTEYHENGSLCDYLKSHLISYNNLLKISEGIAKGLTFLHEEFSAKKPAIAHRDFKSKNVLLKDDLTPCIGDFGLALIFHPNRLVCDALGQVGTRRYMAPEVLEGAINFSRDGLLRIDMYACGLVLWEVLSRCSIQDGPIGNYMLPFEEEVGQHPTLEDMQETVCQQKKRPEIKQTWKDSSYLRLICDTIEECWDQDAEARLSASCIVERISSQRLYSL